MENMLVTKRVKNYNILIYLFLFLFFIQPFVPVISSYVGGPIISGLKDTIVIILIMAIAFAISIKKDIKLKRFDIFLIVYIMYGFCHVFIALTDLQVAIDKFRLVFLYPILSLLLIIYLRNISVKKINKDLVVNLFIFQGVVVLIFSILEFVFQDKLLHFLYRENYQYIRNDLLGQTGIRLVSTLYNPINLGIFLNLFLVFLLYKKEKINVFGFSSRILRVLLIFLTIIITLLTYSRISYLIVVGTFILFVLFNSRKILSIKTISLIIFLLLILPIGGSFLGENIDNLNRRFSQISIEHLKENDRIDNWKTYLKEMSSIGEMYLIWGGGLGTSNSDSKSQDVYVKRVENSYVSFLGELGTIGLIMFAVILGKMFINLISLLKTNSTNSKIFLQLLFVLMIAALTNDVFQNNPFSFYFWCMFTYSEMIRIDRRKMNYGVE